MARFCHLHYPSVIRFWADPGPSFKVLLDEDIPAGTLAHITTGATCIASLEMCSPLYQPSGAAQTIAQVAAEYAAAAVRRKEWISDGAAEVYCRSRGLPPVLGALSEDDVRTHRESIIGHLGKVWEQVVGERFAVGELTQKGSYPPNSFHTYWAIKALRAVERRIHDLEPNLIEPIKQKVPGALLWTRQLIGTQVSLHVSHSSHRDSDQLAWAVSTLLDFSDQALPEREIQQVGVALECIFSTQLDYGGWPRFEPLFHYPEAGNAYCYTQETFAVLLRCARLPQHEFFKRALFKHRENLLRMFDHLERTAVPLGRGGMGWCSGHSPRRTQPEGWATASVFESVQELRRLFGVWTREAAETDLGVRQAPMTREKAPEELRARGDSWLDAEHQPARYLSAFFVNAVALDEKRRAAADDPDAPLIPKEHARSAILFGPPGTSKTTLVGAIAGAIAWKYLAVHASDFVRDGLPNVQARADWIFSRLMELDHCVVLFDEIDELVRDRGGDADAFGRFLTTSMLPRIAELWNQARVLYFVATNLLRDFDQAVTRSQRFDLKIFVAPPSYEAKLKQLKHLLGAGFEVTVTADEAGQALQAIEGQLSGLPDDEDVGKREVEDNGQLAKLVVLRWDQVDELAHLLKMLPAVRESRVVGVNDMKNALAEMKHRNLNSLKPYREFVEQRRAIERDFGRLAVFRITGDVTEEVLNALRNVGAVIATGDEIWLETAGLGRADRYSSRGFHCEEPQPGELRFKRM